MAHVDVPFDDLVGDLAHEERVRHVASVGGSALVLGGSGEGKSGLVSSALSVFDGWMAVLIPVSVPHPDGALPNEIPGMVLNGFANVLAAIDRSESARALIAARAVRPRRRWGGTLNLKGLQVTLGDLFRDEPQSGAEQLDAVRQAVVACEDGGLRVVLVLDDTDKWASNDDRLRAGRAFFDQSLGSLLDLGLPVVANAHPRYFEADTVPSQFDAVVRVPRISRHGVVAEILAHRLAVCAEPGPAVGDIFEEDALTAIGDLYERADLPLRRVVQNAGEALLEADEAGLERITLGAVEAAVDVLS